MKTLFATILLAAPLLADFNYESKTTLTGGSCLPALSEKPPLDKPIVATHMIKGTRMAAISKGRTVVVDLGPQTILEINLAKKTYSLMTFAQMKQILDRAMKARKNPAPATYRIDSKPSGGTKAFGFFNARELIVSMNLDGSVPATQTAAHVLVDFWRFTMPGFGEAEDFRAKLAEKLSPAYASGLSAIGILEPELLPAFEEIGKLSSPGDDMPVQTIIRIGNPSSGDLAPVPEAPAPQKGVVSGTISRIGSLARRKSASAEDPDAVYPGLLLELTTELSNFGSGPADESKFNVPEGFKQVK